jgi:tetratricopeptide (TPR) repeat protein
MVHLLILVFSQSLFGVIAQEQSRDFQQNFNIAKQHLSQRRVMEAAPYLDYLLKSKPGHANLKYLLGVCYTEAEIIHPYTIQLLEEATQRVSLEYDPNSLEEERVPVYVYFYLSVAYAQQGMCEKAETTRRKFIEVYPHDDDYYFDESKRWLKLCEKGLVPARKDSLPEYEDFTPFSSQDHSLALVVNTAEKTDTEVAVPISLENEKKEILTKSIEYSTDYPLYGVQLGAYNEVFPVSRFKNLSNIDAFMDKQGLIRYVVGRFSFHSQAMSLLEAVKQKGYRDAFVVNVNDNKKFSESVVSVNQINIKARLQGKVSYAIQIGAFKEQLPSKVAQYYLDIEGIHEIRGDSLTYLSVGNYETYDQAKANLPLIEKSGINDAFVIAINQGKKIPLKRALEFKP